MLKPKTHIKLPYDLCQHLGVEVWTSVKTTNTKALSYLLVETNKMLDTVANSVTSPAFLPAARLQKLKEELIELGI